MALNHVLLVDYKLVRAVATWLGIGRHRLRALGAISLLCGIVLTHLYIDQVMLLTIIVGNTQLVQLWH